jgi:tetratricopeptide (TPR) repeat protein
MAFNMDMDPEEARKAFSRPDDLIFKDGKAWVPVEITMIKDGFLAAWQTGAKEWRESNAAGTARFYTIQEARMLFEPVAFAGIVITAEPVRMDLVIPAYDAELERFINGEIKDKVAALRAEIAKSRNDPKALNKLGVLYARFGMYDKANEELSRAAVTEYAPALVNLGNIALLQNDIQESLGYFERAIRREPDNLSALVGMAKANYELENMGSVRTIYKKIEGLDAKTAARLSYLVSKGDESARAAEAGRDEAFWDERN